MSEERTHKFSVEMTCSGCSNAITRVLERAKTNGEGISSYRVDLEAKEVYVTGTISYEDALAKIKKTGKTVHSGETLPLASEETVEETVA